MVLYRSGGNRIGGTLYSSFISITDLEFYLVNKLDNSRHTYWIWKRNLREIHSKGLYSRSYNAINPFCTI
jgi:hypothetical protein